MSLVKKNDIPLEARLEQERGTTVILKIIKHPFEQLGHNGETSDRLRLHKEEFERYFVKNNEAYICSADDFMEIYNTCYQEKRIRFRTDL